MGGPAEEPDPSAAGVEPERASQTTPRFEVSEPWPSISDQIGSDILPKRRRSATTAVAWHDELAGPLHAPLSERRLSQNAVLFDKGRDGAPQVVLHFPQDPSHKEDNAQIVPENGALSGQALAAEPLPVSEGDVSSTMLDGGDSLQLQQKHSDRLVYDPSRDTQETKEQLLHGAGNLFEPDDSLAGLVQHGELGLQKSLRRARIKVADGRYFIPIDKLAEIITTNSVQVELHGHFPKMSRANAHKYAAVIAGTVVRGQRRNTFTSRRRIFATLVLIERVTTILDFIREGLYDSDLPFQLAEFMDTEQTEVLTSTPEPVDLGRQKRLQKCFQGDPWTGYSLDSFDRYQWEMLAPIFFPPDDPNEKVRFYPFHDSIILPFVYDEFTPSSGGFSTVWKVKVHKAHRFFEDDADNDDPAYAIKMLHSDSKVDFDHEVNTLKRLSFKNHDHLIKLLVTFRLRKRYYLLFPLADANLKDFWKRIPEPPVDENWAFWISDQCYGLANGLNVIHHLEESSMGSTAPGKALFTKAERANFGRHGDIKPENILWFQALENKSVKGLGLLKISDFGLTRWHRQSSIGKSDAGMASVSLTYRGPECDTKKTLSPLYDIWTLGCVYIEFVTWYLLGYKSVIDEFPNHRTPGAEHTDDVPQDTYFELYWLNEDAPYESQQVGARVKGAVLEWIDQLHTHPNCSQFLHDFLDYIEASLLRVETEERAPCEQVVAKLHSLYETCKADPAYCKNGMPKSLAPRPARVPAKSEPSAKKRTHRRIPFSAFTWMKKGDSMSTQHSQNLSDDDDTCPTRPSFGSNARGLLSHMLNYFGVPGSHTGVFVRAMCVAAGLATSGWLAARAVSMASRFAWSSSRPRQTG